MFETTNQYNPHETLMAISFSPNGDFFRKWVTGVFIKNLLNFGAV